MVDAEDKSESCSESLQAFITYLRDERRLAENTVEAYRRDIGHLIRFLDKQTTLDASLDKSPDKSSGLIDHNEVQKFDAWQFLTPAIARQFPARLNAQGLSSKSIQRALSAARSFYRYMLREKHVKLNPFEGVKAPRGQSRLPEALSVDELSQLLDGMPRDDLALRDRAIMELV